MTSPRPKPTLGATATGRRTGNFDPDRLRDCTLRTVEEYQRRFSPVIFSVMANLRVPAEDFGFVMNEVLLRLHRQFATKPVTEDELHELVDEYNERTANLPFYLRDRGSFSAWVGRLTGYVCREHMRKVRRNRLRFPGFEDLAGLPGDDGGNGAEFPAADADAAVAFDEEDMKRAWREIMSAVYYYLKDRVGISPRNLNLFAETLAGADAETLAKRRGLSNRQVVYNATKQVRDALRGASENLPELEEYFDLARAGGAHAHAFQQLGLPAAFTEGFAQFAKAEAGGDSKGG